MQHYDIASACIISIIRIMMIGGITAVMLINVPKALTIVTHVITMYIINAIIFENITIVIEIYSRSLW